MGQRPGGIASVSKEEPGVLGGGARDGGGTGTEEHTDPRPLCRWFLPLTSAFCPSDTGPRSRLQVGHWVGRVQWMTGQAKHSPFPAKASGDTEVVRRKALSLTVGVWWAHSSPWAGLQPGGAEEEA